MKKLLALLSFFIGVAFADTPPQIINKQCSANQFFSQIQPGPGNINCTQPSYSGLSGLPSFIDSLQLVSGNVSLVGDSATVGNTMYYGTNASGTKGFYSIPANDAVWGLITGTLSNQTDLQTALNGKQASGNYITSLTGDGTASGPGASAFTLATVNSNTGSFGSASSSPNFTVNAKGLITAAGSSSIQIAESQVTNLVSDLSGKQPTGNYITALTGDVAANGPGSVSSTIQANVVSNSKLATMTSETVKANKTGSTANPTDVALGTLTESTSSVLTLGNWANATLGSPTIQVKQAGTSQSGYLSSTDWNTFNSKGSGTVTSVTASAPIASSGGTTPNLSLTGIVAGVNGGTGSSSWATGSIPYGNGSNGLTQDSSNFHWDATNHRLGIGLTSPAYSIDENGTIQTNTNNTNYVFGSGTPNFILNNTSNVGQTLFEFTFNGTVYGGLRGDYAGNFNYHASDGSEHDFFTSLDDSSQPLGLTGNGAYFPLNILDSQGGFTAIQLANRWLIDEGGNTTALDWDQRSLDGVNGNSQIQWDDGNGNILVTAAQNMTFSTNQTFANSLMTLDGSGNLLSISQGTYMTPSSTNTVTNKSISGSSNTFTNIPLSSAVTGNLAVTHLNSGTSASSTTFWRGDGTWATPTGGGTVTSVAATVPTGLAVSGSPITGSGTLGFTWSGTIPASSLPNPSATTLGGIESLAAVTSKWINTISTSGVPSSTQPAFTDISGSVAASQMPALTGDVTTSAGAVATTISANAVTNSKLAQMTANTIKGNNTGSTANAADLTVSQVQTMLGTSGTNTGDVTIGTFGSTPNANGASIASQVLTLQPADATHPGLLTTAAQTFAGVKTFSSAPSFSSITNTGTLTLPTASDTLVGRATTDTLTNKTISGASNTLSSIADSSLSTSYIKADGTRALTGNWSAGSFSGTFNSVAVGSSANTIQGVSTIQSSSNNTGVTIASGGAVQIVGDTSGATPTSGTYGEIVTIGQNSSGLSVSDANAHNCTSGTLAAGHWLVWGFMNPNSSFTGTTQIQAGISASSLTFSGVNYDGSNAIENAGVAGSSNVLNVGPLPVTVSTGTTYYFVFQASGNVGSGTVKCTLYAERVH